MLIQPNLNDSVRVPKEKKRMLEVRSKPTHWEASINYSSLDIIEQCLRKAKYLLHDELVRNTEAPALTTGSGVHKAMEVWYSAPAANRKPSSFESDQAIDYLLAGQDPGPIGGNARVAAIFAYLEAVRPLIGQTTLGAREPSNVVWILNEYFDNYIDDGLEVYRDDLGPFVERHAEIRVPHEPFDVAGLPVEIYWHGTIDMVLKSDRSKKLIVADHKTTSSLGKDFFNRIKPNFQYTGYFWAAQSHFGLDVSEFMVNGIQIAKTKREFNRQLTTITEEEISELHLALTENVRHYLSALVRNKWPMSAPNSCSMWGGCEFRNVCEAPAQLKPSIIRANYGK